jgi:hypothetical protein
MDGGGSPAPPVPSKAKVFHKLLLEPGAKQGEVPIGTPVGSLLSWHLKNAAGSASDRILVATLLNGEISSNHTKIEPRMASAAPVYLDSAEGIAVYRRSLAFVVSMAVAQELRGARLVVSHSMKDYFVADIMVGEPVAVSPELVSRVEQAMRSLVERALPISSTTLSYQRALGYFSPLNSDSGQRYALYSLCAVLTMRCTHYALYSLCTRLTIRIISLHTYPPLGRNPSRRC